MARTYGANKVLEDQGDKILPTIKAALFMANLKKGDIFNIGDTQYEVLATTAKTLRIKSENQNFNFKPDFFEKYSVWITNKGKGHDKGDNFMRDIEGILILDSINQLNPFYELSKVGEILKRDELYSD